MISKEYFYVNVHLVSLLVQERLEMLPAGCMKLHLYDRENRIGRVPIFSGITSQLLFPEMTSPDL